MSEKPKYYTKNRADHQSNEQTCRYCKESGHTINKCPTRPPRAPNGQGRGRPDKRDMTTHVEEKPIPDLDKMFWPTLDGAEEEMPRLQGAWATGSIRSILLTNKN